MKNLNNLQTKRRGLNILLVLLSFLVGTFCLV